jgi:hypothetical protein
MHRSITFRILLLVLLLAPFARAAAADERLDLASLVDVAPLDDDASRVVAAHVIARLRGEPAPELPAGVRDDAQPRAVLVSVSNGTEPARVVMAVDRGAARAADAAVARAEKAVPDADARQWVKVDIVRHAQPLPPADPVLGFDTSLQGIGLDVGGGVALLPEEVTGRGLVAANGRLRGNAVREYLASDARRSEEDAAAAPIGEPHATHRFTAAAFFAAADDAEPAALFRGHRPFPPDAVDADELLLAAGAGAAYLAGATGEDGQFAYIYQAAHDEVAPDDYNIVRHAGACWAMLDTYGSTRDADLLAAADRAIAFMVEQVRPVRIGGKDVVGLVWDDEVSLGGNAIAVLTLADHARVTGESDHLKTAVALGDALRAAQTRSGRFLVQRQRLSTGQQFASDSPYFPGEATLALVRLAAVDPDPARAAAWLDAAELAAQYLITVRDAAVADADLPHDHWLLYALDALHRVRPREMYVEHAMRLAAAVMPDQAGDRAADDAPDRAGSWSGGRSNPSATRVEGIMAAARLARDYGRPDEATRFLAAARRGAAFQLRTQVRPESAMYFPHPTRVLGAIREDLRGTDIRIDTVQHSIAAMLAVQRALAAR